MNATRHGEAPSGSGRLQNDTNAHDLASAKPGRHRDEGWISLRWPPSALFNILAALAAGLAYALLILTPQRLNPGNVSWLAGDPATYYIGASMLSQDPAWHWPLTFTDRIGFPIGDAVALMDPNSLLALFTKALAPLLPATFQYLGLSVVLSCALQFYFGARLMRSLIGPHLWPVLSGALLLMVSPAMTWRFGAHYALANHWLILAALCIYLGWQRHVLRPGRRLALLCALLCTVAIAVNIYLAFSVAVLLLAACGQAVWESPARWKQTCAIACLSVGSLVVSAWAIGLIQAGSGFAAAGYRIHSMNLFGPIDSAGPGSLLLPRFALENPGQYEGYNYLGLGTLAMLAASGSRLLCGRWRPRWRSRDVLPIVGLCVIFTLLALSTKITAGAQVLIDVDPRERLTPYLGAFRGSGRLFWVPYYFITVGAVVGLFHAFRPAMATVLAFGGLFLQVADEAPLRRHLDSGLSNVSAENRLQSPIWRRLGEKHQNLIVLPPWQCGEGSPGGQEGYRIFGMLAASQHMRINSYVAARYSPGTLAYHCDGTTSALAVKSLRDDTAYVLAPKIAASVGTDGTRGDLCHDVDGFLLCSAVSDFGMGRSASLHPLDLPAGSMRFAGNQAAASYLGSGWHDIEAHGVWSTGNATLRFRLTPEQLREYGHVSLHLEVPLARNPARVSASSGDSVTRREVEAGRGTRMLHLRLALSMSPNGIQTILLRTEPPLRPKENGYSEDPRTFGAGLVSLGLEP